MNSNFIQIKKLRQKNYKNVDQKKLGLFKISRFLQTYSKIIIKFILQLHKSTTGPNKNTVLSLLTISEKKIFKKSVIKMDKKGTIKIGFL